MIADGAIAIAGHRIELVGKSDEIENRFQADETIDGRTLIAIPGLIDTNVATVAQLGRGAADFCDIPKFMLEPSCPTKPRCLPMTRRLRRVPARSR